MKNLNNEDLLKYEAGTKCIYHSLLHVYLGILPGGLLVHQLSGNARSVSECWNGTHQE